MEMTPNWILLVVSILACLGGVLMRSCYCKRMITNTRGYHLQNCCNSVVCALMLLAMGGKDALQFSGFTLLLGLAFGLITMAQGLSNSAALHAGPLSYTTVIVSLASIIPAVSGALFWNERISVLQIVGIILLAVCFVCSVNKDEDSSKASLRWLALCVVAFLATGGIGVMQKIHQSSEYKAELSGFLIIAFLFSAISALILYLVTPSAPVETPSSEGTIFASTGSKRVLLLAGMFLVLGICSAINNKFNLYLSGIMPSAVFFPLVNGSNLVLSTVASVVLFKEKLSHRQWVGMVLGTVAVLLLCL